MQQMILGKYLCKYAILINILLMHFSGWNYTGAAISWGFVMRLLSTLLDFQLQPVIHTYVACVYMFLRVCIYDEVNLKTNDLHKSFSARIRSVCFS